MRLVQWTERLLMVFGVACLSWAGTTWLEAYHFQREQARALDARLTAARQQSTVTSRTPAPGTTSAAAPAPTLRDTPVGPSLNTPASDAIGRLEIPRLGVSVVVMPGDDEATLSKAVGHLSDTPLPWAGGNAALAGHRDTFFRPLERAKAGDDIYLDTPRGRLHYRVRRTVVVEPEDLWVLDPSATPTLTLITCYPFKYVGPAPKRFIVQADRV